MTSGILRCCTPRRVLNSSVFTVETRNICHTPNKCKNITGIDEVGRKWHIYSAVCVERHPVIQAKMTKVEKKTFDLFNKLNIENSMKADHELALERDATTKEHGVQTQESLTNTEQDISQIQKAVDLEDLWKTELKNFEKQFPSMSADDTDFRSLDRKLDRNLVLIIKQKLGKTEIFLPPQVIRNPDESMRDAAERCLKTVCGPDFNARIYGNAPCGFVKYSYPKRIHGEGYYGAKVFYFLAKYLEGDIPQQERFQWVDREELAYALPEVIKNKIFRFLLPE